MEAYTINQTLKSEKGITLLMLVITIVVMIIIASISINIGLDSLDSTRLKGFYTELEIIQRRIDVIATTNESYIDDTNNIIYLRNQGTAYDDLTESKKSNLQEILSTEGEELNLNAATFRYFTIEQLETILGLSNMQYDVFVDFDTRTVIAEYGVLINRNKISYSK